MGNKEAKKAIILLFLGIIIFSVLLIGISIGRKELANKISNQPEFKITKEECYDNLKELSEKPNWTFEEICEEIILKRGYRDFLFFNYDYWGGRGVKLICNADKIEKNNKGFYDLSGDDIYVEIDEREIREVLTPFGVEIEEICKQVEVDEIEECSGSYLCKDKPECCLGYYLETDSLTTNWLNNNCVCLEIKKECSKYSCGEYQVEVIN